MSTIKLVGGPYDGGRMMFAGDPVPAIIYLRHGPRMAAYNAVPTFEPGTLKVVVVSPHRFAGYVPAIQEAK